MNNLTIPEKDRERLVEICKTISPKCEKHECGDCPHSEKEYPSCKAELIADALLAKGIIVPPCQIGDELYIIDWGEVVPVYVSRIRYNVENRDEWIRKDNLESKCQIFAWNDMGKAYEIYPKYFGLTTFYKREEAEKCWKNTKNTLLGKYFALYWRRKLKKYSKTKINYNKTRRMSLWPVITAMKSRKNN